MPATEDRAYSRGSGRALVAASLAASRASSAACATAAWFVNVLRLPQALPRTSEAALCKLLSHCTVMST